jgi:hypothetical protein
MAMSSQRYYRVFTYDLRSPIRSGDPVWDGALPYRLPAVEVDTSPYDCGAGWHACRTLGEAMQISRAWHDFQPCRAFVLRDPEQLVERQAKLRAASWTVVEEIDPWDYPTGEALVEVWAECARSTHTGRSGGRLMPDLREADLRGANLGGASLYEAYLREADLSEAYLREANLYGADLGGANLYGASLYEAYLCEAYLREANLSEANLSEADLSEADLSEADLYGAYLCEANLSGANLRRAYLGGANLCRADLRGAGLRGADLGEWERGPDGYGRRIPGA